MVQDPSQGGYPMRCPRHPHWRGVFVNPRDEGWPVEACEEHIEGLQNLHRGRAR
jgi:hypothetical protein